MLYGHTFSERSIAANKYLFTKYMWTVDLAPRCGPSRTLWWLAHFAGQLSFPYGRKVVSLGTDITPTLKVPLHYGVIIRVAKWRGHFVCTPQRLTSGSNWRRESLNPIVLRFPWPRATKYIKAMEYSEKQGGQISWVKGHWLIIFMWGETVYQRYMIKYRLFERGKSKRLHYSALCYYSLRCKGVVDYLRYFRHFDSTTDSTWEHFCRYSAARLVTDSEARCIRDPTICRWHQRRFATGFVSKTWNNVKRAPLWN